MPALPVSVPIGDPSSMLQQRPDIRAAERRLASSNAQIGEHTADFFPKVTLLGDLGFSAADPGHLVRKNNFSWLGVPYLQWNVLDFGRTLSSIHNAEASRDEADAKYTHTVLAALQDANTSLSRYGHQREHLATLQQVQASADRSATLMPALLSRGVEPDRFTRYPAHPVQRPAECGCRTGRIAEGFCVVAEEPGAWLALAGMMRTSLLDSEGRTYSRVV